MSASDHLARCDACGFEHSVLDRDAAVNNTADPVNTDAASVNKPATNANTPPLATRDPELWRRLVARAWWLSARYYGAPVYLVGSAVTSDDPRDHDLVVILPDDLFVCCYGDRGETHALNQWRYGPSLPDRAEPPAIWRRWARDVARQGANLTAEFHTAVDFKVQCETFAAALDAMPRHLLARVR